MNNDVMLLLPAGSVRLKGILGKSLQKTTENRLKKIDYKLLTDAFRNKQDADLKWRGEFWGKIVRSAILAWSGCKDPELKKLIDETVKELLSTQTPEGCISSYPENIQLQGWDLWGRKYAILGLLRYYEIMEHDPEILQACKKIMDHLISQLNGRDLNDFGDYFGLPASSILIAVIQLYKHTRQPEYLQIAEKLVNAGCCYLHNIFTAVELGVPPAQIASAKAYEMTSCFEGLCEYYRIRKDEKLKTILLNYYRMVRDREIFITGGGGLKDLNGEFWYDGTFRQTELYGIGSLGETCVTTTWLHYCDHLLRLTGDPTIADEMEKSFYNALLGAMAPDGSGWAHRNPTPLAGKSHRTLSSTQIPGFGDHDCCLAQGPEGLAMAPGYSFMASEKGITINGYEDSSCTFITPSGAHAELEITGNYPCCDTVSIKLVLPENESLKLLLRIPGWSKTAEIRIGDSCYLPEGGTYFTLEQRWDTETCIVIKFDMQVEQVKSPDQKNFSAYRRGPLVLAQDSRFENGKNASDEVYFSCKAGNRILCDYASAGNRFSPDNTLQVWFPPENTGTGMRL